MLVAFGAAVCILILDEPAVENTAVIGITPVLLVILVAMWSNAFGDGD